jgi:AAA+ superfamily predicted ATPase
LTGLRPTTPFIRRLDPFADLEEDASQLRGDAFRRIFNKVRRVIEHQFTKRVRRGIKGFLFWGDVGVGKTVMAKALARDLGCTLVFIDGSDIARARYGESEQMITEIFKPDQGRRIILIDDAESVFPRRDWVKGESWHVAQNNVLFHELDKIDTSQASVILTTNEISLMDRAVRDRLYSIEFPYPSKETLIQIAKDRCEQLLIPWERVVEEIERRDDIRSIREVEKLVLEQYAGIE